MDDARREIRDGAIFVRGNRIEQVGTTTDLPSTADQVIELSGHVLMPGLINTHHHMYQSLTRAVPGAQDSELFGWLKALYLMWARLTPEAVRVSALTSMAELILSGCTTSSDHLYVLTNGCRIDDTIEAAATIGLRFHPTRGAMSLGESKGGLPPDSVVEEDDAILRDMRRVVEAHHDASRYSMLRMGVAPCSPFSVTPDLMREAAVLARSYGVGMHTHLAENVNDVAFSRERYRKTPAEYAESLGWVGADVWHAHCVHLDAPGIATFARTHTAWRTVRARTCGSDRAPHPCSRCATRASTSGSAWTAARRTTALTCSARRGRQCSWRDFPAIPVRCVRATCWKWRLAAVRRCSAATMWDRLQWVWRQTSSRSTSVACSMRARCTIRSPRLCSAMPQAWRIRSSTAMSS
jgi:hypothetical protein